MLVANRPNTGPVVVHSPPQLDPTTLSVSQIQSTDRDISSALRHCYGVISQ